MWWNHVPVSRELTVPRDRDWDPKIERQWQRYTGNYGSDHTALLERKKMQDRKRIRVEQLEEKIDTIIEAYFGCYSKLLGVESKYPQGPIALNLELVNLNRGLGHPYPAIIPISYEMSITHIFERYKIKRIDELNDKEILAYSADRMLRAIRVPNDDFILWTDRAVEWHEDDLSEQLSGR